MSNNFHLVLEYPSYCRHLGDLFSFSLLVYLNSNHLQNDYNALTGEIVLALFGSCDMVVPNPSSEAA